MVKRYPLMRVSPSFIEFRTMMKKQLAPIIGRPPSDREITEALSGFLLEENMHQRMINRARYRQRLRYNRVF